MNYLLLYWPYSIFLPAKQRKKWGIYPNSTDSFYSLHDCVLHDLVASEDPVHSAPPLSGVVLVLQRLCEPPPHVLEHDVHDFQALQVQSTEK